jgi:pyridoxine 5'-phosphate synthase PdxJ
MSKREQVMFAQGWVSAARAAARLGVHVVTVHRLTTSGRIRERDVQIVGKTKFIRMKALAEAHDPAVRKAFNLDDWSDLEKTLKDGA